MELQLKSPFVLDGWNCEIKFLFVSQEVTKYPCERACCIAARVDCELICVPLLPQPSRIEQEANLLLRCLYLTMERVIWYELLCCLMLGAFHALLNVETDYDITGQRTSMSWCRSSSFFARL